MTPKSLVSRKQLAHILSVSTSAITQWVAEGAPCLSRGRPGVAAQFDAREFLAWWKENVVLAPVAARQQVAQLEEEVLAIEAHVSEGTRTVHEELRALKELIIESNRAYDDVGIGESLRHHVRHVQ